ncbi:MAG: hypothetical protein ACREFY_14945, partial [Acetobacteraceae bacterium]
LPNDGIRRSSGWLVHFSVIFVSCRSPSAHKERVNGGRHESPFARGRPLSPLSNPARDTGWPSGRKGLYSDRLAYPSSHGKRLFR